MNVNIEVDTNNASDLMFEAEDVGMVDDIVRLLMGDGDIVEPEEVLTFDEIEFVDEPDSSLNEEALEGFYNNIANSVSLLNESANAAAYMSENFVNEVRIFIEDLINGDYLEDQAQYILNQFALLNSNGGFLPDEISALTTAQQSLANIMNSMSIMSNFQYAQQSVNKYV
jgi:hypothetical protein